jgi:hypothetical protein
MYNRVNTKHSWHHQPFSHMLTSIDVRKLQFVHENQMHPILRPNYMSHMIPAIDLARILLWGHLSGIWGLIPKQFEHFGVCRVDLYMIFFASWKGKNSIMRQKYLNQFITFFIVNGQVSCTTLGLRLKRKNWKSYVGQISQIDLRKFRRRARYRMSPIPLPSVVEAKSCSDIRYENSSLKVLTIYEIII